MGGGSKNQTVTQNTSNIPAYARPYYESMMKRATTASNRPYETYRGERIADLNEGTKSGINDVFNLQAINPAMTSGMNATSNAATGMANIAQNGQNIGQVSAGQWDTGAMQKYMSPYVEGVINKQKEAAYTDFARQSGNRASEAVAAGALGGSRRGVADYLAEEGLNSRLGSIEAEGLQAAYTSGMEQFNQDRRSDVEVQQANIENFLKGQGLSMDALQGMTQSSQALFDMGQKTFDQQKALAQEKIKAGQVLTDHEQRILDMRYDDFINQRDYDKQQIGWYSSILNGMPISANSNTVTSQGGGANGLGAIAAGIGALNGGQASTQGQ